MYREQCKYGYTREHYSVTTLASSVNCGPGSSVNMVTLGAV